MATTTYVPLATTTLGSAQSSITINSISNAYTDLVIVAAGSLSLDNQNNWLRLNSDSSTIYSTTMINGNGSAINSTRRTGNNAFLIDYWGTGASGAMNNFIIHINNYANTNIYKTVLVRSNDTTSETQLTAGLYRSTSAISSVTLFPGGGNYNTGFTLTVYGIANADTGALATGGVITYDNTYYYHTFTSSGTFTPKQALTADILVVAGGGGGGSDSGGGGGAGGLLAFTSQSLSATNYSEIGRAHV